MCLCCVLLLQARRSRHRAKRRRPPWHSKQPPFRVLLQQCCAAAGHTCQHWRSKGSACRLCTAGRYVRSCLSVAGSAPALDVSVIVASFSCARVLNKCPFTSQQHLLSFAVSTMVLGVSTAGCRYGCWWQLPLLVWPCAVVVAAAGRRVLSLQPLCVACLFQQHSAVTRVWASHMGLPRTKAAAV